MKILAVDDEHIGLLALADAIGKAAPEAEIISFSDPEEALAYCRENPVNVAFLDIFMEGMDGIDLAKEIKFLQPEVHIVFQTGYDEYMGDAFRLHARGYVLKPVTPKKIKEELENIYGISRKTGNPSSEKQVRFQCFGNFEVYVNGSPLHFKYDKTKEMIAYVVSRNGALCSNNEIIVNLWESDEDHGSYLRGLRKDLFDVLREFSAEDVFIQQRGKIAVNPEKVSCDYYDFLKGDIRALNRYRGEFMAQYSWGEFINAELEFSQKKNK